ncbi:MAG: PDDEXK nuclease domain-containing protein [Syntrophales bacterium]|jgi:predicted nuclease of restriction endonuclease-like (RecB) superfamily|nr:PDDEXK nuclease domain-containing protein [Syntrophales bacterium]
MESRKREKKLTVLSARTSLPAAVDGLFARVTAILDRARGNAVRSVNSEMLLAYWHIGREIVEALQGGSERAEYGSTLIETLAQQLTRHYGKGFSSTNLRYFRTFYQVYAERTPEIRHMACGESGADLDAVEIRHTPCGVLDDLTLAVEHADRIRGFSPRLGWSQYRALMNVENKAARLFYEIEAEKAAWSVSHLERQIHTLLFARLLKSRDKAGLLNLANEGQVIRKPTDVLKDPYVLDFLDLPDGVPFHESDLEEAIIGSLQEFLLELGKGFAFVARQKRLAYEDEHFYVDLVFYNCILKCYVLIDLKIGKLTHQDIGQMDSYVRLFDDRFTTAGDKPTIGLILCAAKNEAIARYSVLNESKRIFAAKYVKILPTEDELQRELLRERRQIEASRRAADEEKR